MREKLFRSLFSYRWRCASLEMSDDTSATRASAYRLRMNVHCMSFARR
jgi:hypothetical protein